MRFHVVSLPHTQVTKEYCWCAYTSKVLKFCNMMTSLGHEVYLYGGTQNEAKVTEFITVVPEDDHKKWFGHYNWDVQVFDQWSDGAACWMTMNHRAAAAIRERRKPGDILCLTMGISQEPIAAMVPGMRSVETGIGYEGIIRDGLHVFESYAWMHFVYGQMKIMDGRFFDTVIPNSFEDTDYTFKSKKDDYLLYLGRLTSRKGMEIVKELAKSGHKIKMAGQGDLRIPYTEYLGVVRGHERAELLANAKALLCPTIYIEPFGGVAVEAMLSGTPVICTDFGAFTETVHPGVNGFRCHTLNDFENATRDCERLHPDIIRDFAKKYLTENIRHEYDTYFKRVATLDGQGWYAKEGPQ